MACNSLANIVRDCLNNIGGFNRILINDMDNLGTVAINSSTNVVTSFGTLTEEFVEIELLRNTSSYVEDVAVDFTNGSTVATATITLMVHRRSALSSKNIALLFEGQRDLAVVGKDGNDKYWYFKNARVSAVGEGSGTAKTDGSKYSVTLVADIDTLAPEVDSAIIEALLTPIS